MKVLLYSGGKKAFAASGIGRAISHQKQSLDLRGIDYVEDKESEEYDLVHINTYGRNSRRIADRARKNGKPVVYHAHSTKEDYRNSFWFANISAPFFKKWLISCYRKGDIILTPTEYSKKLLVSYGIKQPIYPVSNGIDLSFYETKPTDRTEFRDSYGYSDDDKIIMSVGMLFDRKGILDFVKMAKNMPDYKFIWFGTTNVLLLPPKVQRAVRTKLPNLSFPGYIKAEELKKAYCGADLFVFMSKEETEGIVLLEALAAGARVLIRDIPVFDWLTDKKNVYKAKDYDEFVTLSQKMIAGELPELSRQGREALADKTFDVIGKKLESAYKEALEIVRKRNESSNKKS